MVDDFECSLAVFYIKHDSAVVVRREPSSLLSLT